MPLAAHRVNGRHRIVVVDDSELQCSIWRLFLTRRFGSRVAVETYSDPRLAVKYLTPDVHLLLLDWEMPGLDGRAVLEEACRRGVDRKRIVITSSHSADRLHEVFDCTGCLAVIEKEPKQLAVCAMILDELMSQQPAGLASGAESRQGLSCVRGR